MKLQRMVFGLLLSTLWLSGCHKEPETTRSGDSTPGQASEGMPRRPLELGAKVTSDPEPAGTKWPELTREVASRMVRLSLECADKEYPNKLSFVLESKANIQAPSDATPAFFGCFDWHSSVHGHWTMATILRLFPDLPEAAAIDDILTRHLTPERIAREEAFVEESRNATWERPYGWGWLLRLQAELSTPCNNTESCRRAQWARTLQPLASLLRDKFIIYLQRLSVPVRDGTHSNTAFAMVHAWEYARVLNDQELARILRSRALDYFGKDKNCPAHFEPSGEDFLSPCLGEAQLMALVMPREQFQTWMTTFLPALDDQQFASLRTPPKVLDLKDPRIGHLIGLSFHRATTYQALASLASPAQAVTMRQLAARHLVYGEKQVHDSGYGGAHWLASFNLLAYLASPDFSADGPGTPHPASPGR